MIKFIFVFLLISFCFSSDVVILDDNNFDEQIKANEFIFVKFYAPWCGHCKSLAPIYEEVATELKGKVVIAKVDGTENKELMSRFSISGFPTLKFFIKGQAVDFNAGRTKKDIITWIEKKIAPVSFIKTQEELDTFISSGKAAVAYLSEESGKTFEEFKKTALSFDSYKFAVVSDSSLHGSNTVPSVKLFRGFGDNIVNTNVDATVLKKWIGEEGFPLVDEFSSESFQRVQVKYDVLIFGIFDVTSSQESRKELTDIINTLATEYGSKGIGAMVSDTKNLRADALGASGKFLPTLAGYNTKKKSGLKIPDLFAWDETQQITLESARAWVETILDGSVQAFKKSQPVPEKNDEPVKILVAKNFEQLTKGKNAFVEYYAPWCGHCKKLAPIYDELGAKYSHVQDLVIGKMDTTENWTDYQVQGFPTLVLYKKDGTKIKYDGADRELDTLSAWLEKQLNIKPKSDGHDHKTHGDEL